MEKIFLEREKLIERVEEAMYNLEEEFECEVCELTEEDKTYIEDNYPIEIDVACDGSRYYVIGDLWAHLNHNLKANYIFWNGIAA